MPVLENPRYERFAQELAKGKTAGEAYGLAGYKPCDQNASRLIRNDKVRSRVAELQERVAKRVEVTLESLIAEAEEIRDKALEAGQFGAAIRAVTEKGILTGHRVERAEKGKPGDFSNLNDDQLRQFIALRVTRNGVGASGRGTPGDPSQLN